MSGQQIMKVNFYLKELLSTPTSLDKLIIHDLDNDWIGLGLFPQKRKFKRGWSPFEKIILIALVIDEVMALATLLGGPTVYRNLLDFSLMFPGVEKHMKFIEVLYYVMVLRIQLHMSSYNYECTKALLQLFNLRTYQTLLSQRQIEARFLISWWQWFRRVLLLVKIAVITLLFMFISLHLASLFLFYSEDAYLYLSILKLTLAVIVSIPIFGSVLLYPALICLASKMMEHRAKVLSEKYEYSQTRTVVSFKVASAVRLRRCTELIVDIQRYKKVFDVAVGSSFAVATIAVTILVFVALYGEMSFLVAVIAAKTTIMVVFSYGFVSIFMMSFDSARQGLLTNLEKETVLSWNPIQTLKIRNCIHSLESDSHSVITLNNVLPLTSGNVFRTLLEMFNTFLLLITLQQENSVF